MLTEAPYPPIIRGRNRGGVGRISTDRKGRGIAKMDRTMDPFAKECHHTSQTRSRTRHLRAFPLKIGRRFLLIGLQIARFIRLEMADSL
jgi:hypothetical protein